MDGDPSSSHAFRPRSRRLEALGGEGELKEGRRGGYVAGTCTNMAVSFVFSRLNQAFLTPFAGAGGSGWEADGPGFTLAPSPVGEVAGGGRTPVEGKKRGFREVREREDKEERETRKFKTFFSLPIYVQTRSRSIRFNPEKILLIYEV